MITNRIFFIIVIVLSILAIISLHYAITSQIQTLGEPEKNYKNLPVNVTREIEYTHSDERSFFSRWEANETEHTVIIYLNCIPLTRKKPDRVIDNWTIRWIEDPEIYNETAVDAYENYIKQWAKAHPLQYIGSWNPDSCKKTVYVKVINITPEILGSEDFVENWRIVFVRAT